MARQGAGSVHDQAVTKEREDLERLIEPALLLADLDVARCRPPESPGPTSDPTPSGVD